MLSPFASDSLCNNISFFEMEKIFLFVILLSGVRVCAFENICAPFQGRREGRNGSIIIGTSTIQRVGTPVPHFCAATKSEAKKQNSVEEEEKTVIGSERSQAKDELSFSTFGLECFGKNSEEHSEGKRGKRNEEEGLLEARSSRNDLESGSLKWHCCYIRLE